MDINTKPKEEIEKEIEAIEEEKQEYLDEHPEEGDCEDFDEEEKDIDLIEVSFSEDGINDWVSKLEELRESKESIQLEIDEDTELKINYSEDEE